MTDTKAPESVSTHRKASTEWVSVADIRVAPAAQRKYVPDHAAHIAAEFDLEALGYPVLNYRAGHWWVVDGQHRIGALKIMGWGDQKIECEVYRGMSEEEEADLFLNRDDRRKITPLDRFKIAVTAGRVIECTISKIVEDLELKIGAGAGRISAVNTLVKVYNRAGADVLGRTLLILREAYGVEGMDAAMLDGMALVLQRYGTDLTTERAVEGLLRLRNGVVTLRQKTATLVRTTGQSRASCTASEIVDTINGIRGGRKIPAWFRQV